MLKLRIENFDRLPDGGPLEYAVDRRGFDFGRDQHLDWSLPDKNRIVSGKHCEVRYRDGAYWLTDVSTNGTFLNSSSKRVQSPYKLSDGDKLFVGEYVLSVTVKLLEVAMAPTSPPHFSSSPPLPPPSSNMGIWDALHEAPPPIDARDLMPRPPERDRAPDFLHQAAYVPPVLEPGIPPRPQPAAPAPSPDLWSAQGKIAQNHPVAAEQAPIESPPSAGAGPSSREFVRRFAAGAGIPEELLAKTDAGALAEQSGRLLHLVCLQTMALLHARTEAKALSRSGRRTMIQASDNNPLKFMPTPEEALRIMFGPQTKGYLDAKAAIEGAFADLKMHQMASLAAMQAAITQLFDELSPEAIAKSAESKKSLLSGSKSKQWETYVERWEAKAGRREHGMLGAFLELFAEHYDRLSKHRS